MKPSLTGISNLEKALNRLLNTYVSNAEGKTEKILAERANKINLKIAQNLNKWVGSYLNKFLGGEKATNGQRWADLTDGSKANKARFKNTRNLKNEFYVLSGRLKGALLALDWAKIFQGTGGTHLYMKNVLLSQARVDSLGRTYYVPNEPFIVDGVVYTRRISKALHDRVSNISLTLHMFSALEEMGYFKAASNKEKIVGTSVVNNAQDLHVSNALFGRNTNILRRPFLNDIIERVTRSDVARIINTTR